MSKFDDHESKDEIDEIKESLEDISIRHTAWHSNMR